MEIHEIIISPKELYPTESFVFIKNDILQKYYNEYKRGERLEKPIVFLFDGNYYILRGHHLVLAAIMANVEQLIVIVQDVKLITFWKERTNIISTLKSIGMSTLYDFETIGNFEYKSYPNYYKKTN